MKSKEPNFFWPSFTDLMTSLFFIMLVLYILTYVKLTIQQQATEEQLNKIQQLQASVKELPHKFFTYDSVYKRFSLNRKIEFDFGDTVIHEEYKQYLIDVGSSIRTLIDTLKNKYASDDIKYVVVIEGMASKDAYARNYPLSYERALAVQQLWARNGVMPDESVCEVQIAGSGIGGIGRSSNEPENQRILIQIVPKIGEIK